MYRIGGWRMAIGAAAPFNLYMISKSPQTAAALRIVLWSFQALLALWLISMTVVAVSAIFMKKNVDIRAPRVVRPDRSSAPPNNTDVL